MGSKNLLKRTALTFVAFVMAAVLVKLVWHKIPPFEAGMHTDVVSAQSSAGAGPHVATCPVFPEDNVWNARIDTLKVDPNSDTYTHSMGERPLHPDFGTRYGIPYTEVPAGTKPVDVTFEYKDESDLNQYPIPSDVPIEAGNDAHIILIDTATCSLYEMFSAHRSGGAWAAASGVKMNLKSDRLRTAGLTSADAAGLPIFPGLVRYDEVARGEIRHALRFTLPHTQGAYLWPARHRSGQNDKTLVPMGARFRLKDDFDITRYSKTNQVIMLALRRYGMFLADNGSPMYLSGVPDKRWDDSDLHRLGDIKPSDFEMVDESPLQVSPDSGKAATPR